MRLPWFMHMSDGSNSLVGVLPTPVGTFVRSCANGVLEAAWYPMDYSFPRGNSRQVERIVKVDAADDGETRLEDAVVDFMHGHPELALHTAWDIHPGADFEWERHGSGALATLDTPEGLFFRIHHGEQVTLEHLTPGGRGRRDTLGVYADSCGEETLDRRIDARVRRRIEEIKKPETAD